MDNELLCTGSILGRLNFKHCNVSMDNELLCTGSILGRLNFKH